VQGGQGKGISASARKVKKKERAKRGVQVGNESARGTVQDGASTCGRKWHVENLRAQRVQGVQE
jgi:hypothetical protein